MRHIRLALIICLCGLGITGITAAGGRALFERVTSGGAVCGVGDLAGTARACLSEGTTVCAPHFDATGATEFSDGTVLAPCCTWAAG